MAEQPPEITHGVSRREGVEWQWKDGYLPESALRLFPGINNPTELDQLRYQQSLQARDIIADLAIPRVITIWGEATSVTNPWHITVETTFPLWEIAATPDSQPERHGFLYGICWRILTGMEFNGLPPTLLMDAWAQENPNGALENNHEPPADEGNPPV